MTVLLFGKYFNSVTDMYVGDLGESLYSSKLSVEFVFFVNLLPLCYTTTYFYS